eukprot:TRINITY_DN3683_c1_g1_i1.p1 TRINITY_DN3683_c1_g1~~TRINITY_DN3683_c1_g1_i1.p1  ORF type:complete len:343 (+),score=75.29 TRINITY_DN3683_c1_g1_i1:154-1182(+)
MEGVPREHTDTAAAVGRRADENARQVAGAKPALPLKGADQRRRAPLGELAGNVPQPKQQRVEAWTAAAARVAHACKPTVKHKATEKPTRDAAASAPAHRDRGKAAAVALPAQQPAFKARALRSQEHLGAATGTPPALQPAFNARVPSQDSDTAAASLGASAFAGELDFTALKFESLPHKNIDTEEDADDPVYCSEYAPEIYAWLRVKERAEHVDPHYLRQQRCLSARSRAALIDWMAAIHDRFQLVNDTLFVAVSIADKYFSRTQTDKQHMQLVGVASVLVASKVEEVYAVTVNDLVSLCRHKYTAEDIRGLERRVLRTIEWRVTTPTQLHFMRRFSKVAVL